MSKNLLDQIKAAQVAADAARNLMIAAERQAAAAMELANKNATKEQRRATQKASVQLNALLKDAKEGKINEEKIREYTKQFKQDFNK